MAKVDFSEVAKHNKADDCWMVIKGKVYDLSKFKDEHPGGSAYVTDCAGKEVSELDVTMNFALIAPLLFIAGY